jgi:hypothetical protein
MVTTASTEDLKPLNIERAVGTDDIKLISPIVVFVISDIQETNGMDLRIQ